MEERVIVAIVDRNGDFDTQYYDITNMEGELKDFYQYDENGEDLSFNGFDEYEDDMIERGAIPIKVIEHKI